MEHTNPGKSSPISRTWNYRDFDSGLVCRDMSTAYLRGHSWKVASDFQIAWTSWWARFRHRLLRLSCTCNQDELILATHNHAGTSCSSADASAIPARLCLPVNDQRRSVWTALPGRARCLFSGIHSGTILWILLLLVLGWSLSPLFLSRCLFHWPKRLGTWHLAAGFADGFWMPSYLMNWPGIREQTRISGSLS